jgi:Flp pilus assembly protein protease CpaA
VNLAAADAASIAPGVLLAGLGSLALLLAVALYWDARYRSVPNVIVYGGAALAIAFHTLLPEGLGFATREPGGLGAIGAIAGLVTGVATFLPLYLMRATGPGDVKLLGMVGAFLGPVDTVGVVLLTFLFGALLTIAVPATAGVLARLAHDGRLQRGAAEPQQDPAPRVSYVMAITLATGGWLLLKG